MIQPVSFAMARARSGFMLLLGLTLLVTLVPAAQADAAQTTAVSYHLEARYDVDVHLDWDTRRVDVTTTIDIVNDSGGPVDKLELNTVAAKLGSLKDLRVKVGGVRVSPTITGQTIVVPLGGALADGAGTRIWVDFRAKLGTTSRNRAYYFAKLNGVAQLYRFIPWLSRRIPFGSGNHGEPFLTPTSPRVEVTVSADRKLKWATSGHRVSSSGPRTFTYVAKNVRDFNLAASPNWTTASGKSKDGQTRIYAYSKRHSASRLVKLAREELARYEFKTGVQFPHSTYRVAETGGGLAMESPALIWIPAARSSADLPYLVSHETAHQWWYSTVGNDQSTDAFADEAMADYFARKAHLSIRSSRCKTDRLDREIRGYTDACYFEVIYIQGARFLDNLRKDFGSGGKFIAAVRDYTKDRRFGIGSNSRLLEAFRDEMGDGVLKRYHNRFPSLY